MKRAIINRGAEGFGHSRLCQSMKLAIINRGVPGSGKSTLTRMLKEKALEKNLLIKICSTDELFIDNDGVYRFNMDTLYQKHKENLWDFSNAINNGYHIVVCDNTNTSPKDYKKYVEVAKENGYEVIEVYFIPSDVEDHLERNTHNVPKETIERMIDRLGKNPPIDKNQLYVDPQRFNQDLEFICYQIIKKAYNTITE